jgi:hypothetical protein
VRLVEGVEGDDRRGRAVLAIADLDPDPDDRTEEVDVLDGAVQAVLA